MNKEQVKESLHYIFSENHVTDFSTEKRLLMKLRTPNKKKFNKPYFPVILTAFLLIGVSWFLISISINDKTLTNSKQPEDVVSPDDVEMTKDELQYNIVVLEQERDYYKQVISQLFPHLSEEEQLKFVQSQFVYQLTVNNEAIPKNGVIEVSPGSIDVLLTEKIPASFEIYPPSLYEQGRISGLFLEHLTHTDKTDWEQFEADGAGISGKTYRIEGKSGDMMSFKITEELKDRLQLSTTQITIKVK